MKLDRKDVKRINRSTAFQYIRSRENQTVSCVQISRETKISMPTILKIVDYFEKQGILKAIGVQSTTGVGRKPTLLKFVPDAFCTIGVAFDGKYLECVYVDLSYKVLHTRRVALQCAIGELMTDEIPRQLEAFLAEYGIERRSVFSIGLALPAAVDTGRYITTTPAPLIGLGPRYDFKDQCQALSGMFQCPLYIENDVNAAAIGEFRDRRLTTGDDLVYITLGTGLGSGIVLNGKIRRGKSFAAGEIANLMVGGSYPGCSGATAESLLTPQRILALFDYDVYRNDQANSRENKIRVADFVARQLSQVILEIEAVLNAEHYVLGGSTTEQLREFLFPFIRQYLAQSGFANITISSVSSLFAASQGAGSLASDKALDQILMNDDTE